MFSKLNPLAFFLSFAIGMFFIYIVTPKPEVVIKFPSPWNAGKVLYKSEDDKTCFVYKAEKTECPIDKSLIQPQPISDFQ